ncbi:hypothetical protein HMPREF0202_01694 [Cetobacterium somerae ATCC BAA-474]|uniref:Uncharacterized protein n=1 Tax=Cetobacterium somerae ATCC BAA-474 TaxID=1319815 RepID=U7V9Y9_9FUSO|nr:hypothetical protein [Cetobacterium somerae]ERT68306.1 hypothetical protein HMPREF0202_01694 [Cetobacterium somerae ATCC BAA-474]
MYNVNTYNGTYQLEFRGCFQTFDEAMEEFQKAESEYMENFEYEIGTTEYNQELENFMFNSRIDKIN